MKAALLVVYLFLFFLVISTLFAATRKLMKREEKPWRHLLREVFSASFWATAVLTAIFGGTWYWGTITRARQAAVVYVQNHYSPSEAFYALNSDLPSGTWSAESKDLDCFSADYHCADVQYSFNVMSGAEVKRLVCVWRIRSSWGSSKIVSAEPNNTEARQLFLEVQPAGTTR